jgi:hypothetical protein
MKNKYRAILYETPIIVDFLYIPDEKMEELNRPKPLDVFYLDKKCFKTAEKYFFVTRKWKRDGARLHIEIEEGLITND